jgi:hypothetical protein
VSEPRWQDLTFGTLHLDPGEVLVVQCPLEWSDPDAMAQVQEVFGFRLDCSFDHYVPFIVIPAEMNLSKINQTDLPAVEAERTAYDAEWRAKHR